MPHRESLSFPQIPDMKKVLTFLCCLIVLSALAQQPDMYRINAGKLFNSETGLFEKGKTILVRGDKIEQVKATDKLTAEETSNYTLVDLSASTVMPGLIDCHTHLLYREIIWPGNNEPSMDMNRALTLDGDAYRAIYGAARAKSYIEAGITTVQDLGNSGLFADMALKRAINEGLVPGPRMRTSGPGLSTEGGQLPHTIFKHQDLAKDEYRIVKNAEDGITAVRENVNQGATVIKIFANNTPNNTMLRVEEIRAIVEEAHRYRIRVTAHATNSRSVYTAVMGGVDGIEHGYSIEDSVMDLMVKKGVFLVPTDGDSLMMKQYFAINDPNDSTSIHDFMKSIRSPENRLMRAFKKGVKIAAGSDDYIDFHLPFSVPSKRTILGYNQAGIPVADCLKFATINAAEQANFKGKVGVLKAGYIADIIAVGANVDRDLEELMDVRFVMKEGKLVVPARK
ncbi:MAG: amidohydrolase family protein [Chitinophagaceae bacterium]|nr:MAG: amidohydrolase family protein [Chitinophagaceae bacterium]